MLNDLISILSEDEYAPFVKYLKARNRRGDARNVDLFKAIVSEKEGRLKTELGSNAYNVLRNRLKHRLIDFIAQSTLEKEGSTESEQSKTFITGKRLLQMGKPESAFKLLLKLERETHEQENLTLEGQIQQFMISYAHLPGAPNLGELRKRSQGNYEQQRIQTQLNLAYAQIRLAYQAVEFEGEKIDLNELINRTFAEYALSDEIAYSFSSLRQLVHLADIHGAYTKNYHDVNLFFIQKLESLQGGKSDNAENAMDHIEMLYTIANIYFRKKDFDRSMVYLEQMKGQMERFSFNKEHAYRLKWSMMQALNLNHLGRFEEARTAVDQVLNQNYTSDETTQIRLVLAMLQIQQKEWRECQRTLSKFTRSDGWYEKNLGIEWTLHKLTLEILLHIDLENYDYAEARLKSLLRKYAHFLKTDGKFQAKPFLSLVQVILRDPSVVLTEIFHVRVEQSIQWKATEEEDVFRMNFYAWLKAKMTGKEVYPVLLELMG